MRKIFYDCNAKYNSYSLFTAVRFLNEKHNCDSFNLPLHFLQKLWYAI